MVYVVICVLYVTYYYTDMYILFVNILVYSVYMLLYMIYNIYIAHTGSIIDCVTIDMYVYR